MISFLDDEVKSYLQQCKEVGLDWKIDGDKIKIFRGTTQYESIFGKIDILIFVKNELPYLRHKFQKERDLSPSKDTKDTNEPNNSKDLINTITKLKTSGREVIRQRDEWKKRALEAEDKLRSISVDQNSSLENRWSKLRNFVAHEFHPDKHPSGGIESLVRGQVFKILWAKITELEK